MGIKYELAQDIPENWEECAKDADINVDKVKSPKELILESDPKFYDNAGFEEVK